MPNMPQMRTEIAELRQRCCSTDEQANLPETFEHEEIATKRDDLDECVVEGCLVSPSIVGSQVDSVVPPCNAYYPK